jgi:hypothetical protein
MGLLSKFSRIAALVAIVAGLALPGSAQASLSLTISAAGTSINLTNAQFGQNGATTTYSFGGNNSYAFLSGTGTVLGIDQNLSAGQSAFSSWVFAIQVKITDNQTTNNTSAGAFLFDVTNDVRTNGSGNVPQPVVITASENAFTAPTGSVVLKSEFSGTSSNANPDYSFTSSYSNNASSSYDFSAAKQTATGKIWTSPTSNDAFTIPASTFTLTNTTTLQLNPNETAMTDGKTSLLPGAVATPEPATLALALSGLGTIGLAGVRRLRRRETTTD